MRAMLEIEVPENCIRCPLGHSNAVGSGTICKARKRVFYESYGKQGERAPFCPLRMANEPQTNADFIRGMSDEELAEFIRCVSDLEFDKYCRNLPECSKLLDTVDGIPLEKCRACALDWLRQPKEGA